MKTKILVMAFFSILTTSVFAQRIQVGIKGGASVNKLSGKSFKDEFSWGYHLGGFVNVKLTRLFSIQPEVLFNQVNVDTSSHFSDVYQFNKVGKVDLKYISMPILLNINPVKYLSLQIGPQFGVLINKNKTLVENGRDAFKSGDFSMVGGAQLNFSHLHIYGRYVVGLNNINDLDNQEKWRNQSVQLGIALSL